MAAMEVPLTEKRALKKEDFVVPPDWAVRLVSTNAGKTGRKYPSSWIGSMHTYPGMAQDYDEHWGMHDYGATYEEHWRQVEKRRAAEDNKIVVRGNLREEQYRFWNGSGCSTSEIATCRWCRHWAYGPQAMQLHQDKTDHTLILREIYDAARGMQVKLCFTCGARTRHERWGIPLCPTNRCLNKWRVAPIAEIGSTLLLYARFARQKGLLKEWLNEDGSEKHNIEDTPKQFNWERANSY